MSGHNRVSRREAVSIGLHWLMLLLIALVYVCIELRSNFPQGSSLRAGLATWHFVLGLLVFVLIVLRAAVNFIGVAPHTKIGASPWQHRYNKLMHLALYAFMVGMPLTGWLILSAEGQAIAFLGMQLPQLVGQSASVADWAKELHEVGGTAGYFLIGLHTAVALFHHYVIKDNTLRRMLP